MSSDNVLLSGDPASIAFHQECGLDDVAAVTRSGSRPTLCRDTALRQPARSAKNGSHSHSKKKNQVTAETVLRSFNTWAFKREQPADPQLMLRFIADRMALGKPVSFVLYWGKGPRTEVGGPDTECLDYLKALAERVRRAYEPGAVIKLIFTDTHAELNGHSPQDVREYFAGIEACAGQRGFETCYLSQLTPSAHAVDAVDPNDLLVPEETLRRLSAGARKWYRGDDSPGRGAVKYYQMNMIEKRAVEIAFPGSIFVTFNGSDLRSLFPKDLPIFYMYSLRRGISVKPWFLPASPPSGNFEIAD